MDGVIIIIWVLSLACTAVAGFVVGDTIRRKQERADEAERISASTAREYAALNRAEKAEERAAEAEERARLANVKKAEQETEQINCETCRGGLGNCMVCTMQGYFTGWAPAVRNQQEEDDAK